MLMAPSWLVKAPPFQPSSLPSTPQQLAVACQQLLRDEVSCSNQEHSVGQGSLLHSLVTLTSCFRGNHATQLCCMNFMARETFLLLIIIVMPHWKKLEKVCVDWLFSCHVPEVPGSVQAFSKRWGGNHWALGSLSLFNQSRQFPPLLLHVLFF